MHERVPVTRITNLYDNLASPIFKNADLKSPCPEIELVLSRRIR